MTKRRSRKSRRKRSRSRRKRSRSRRKRSRSRLSRRHFGSKGGKSSKYAKYLIPLAILGAGGGLYYYLSKDNKPVPIRYESEPVPAPAPRPSIPIPTQITITDSADNRIKVLAVRYNLLHDPNVWFKSKENKKELLRLFEDVEDLQYFDSKLDRDCNTIKELMTNYDHIMDKEFIDEYKDLLL